MRGWVHIAVCGMVSTGGLLSAALPAAAQSRPCATAEPEWRTELLEDALPPGALELLSSAWGEAWGRTIGFIDPPRPADPERPGVEPDPGGFRLLSEGVSDALLDPIEAQLDSLLVRPVSEPVRFFVSEGDAVQIGIVDRFEACAPEFQNRAALRDLLIQRAGDFEDRRSKTAVVMVFVEASGQVSEVRIHQSSTHLDMDLAAAEVARVARFRPAMNEGIPVPVWTRFPVTFEVGGGRSGRGGLRAP